MGYFNSTMLYAGINLDNLPTKQAMYALAGRNVVMIIVSLYALISQNPYTYRVAFLMHAARELQDMLIVPLTSTPAQYPLVTFFIFLIVFVIPEIIAFRKLDKMSKRLDSYKSQVSGL